MLIRRSWLDYAQVAVLPGISVVPDKVIIALWSSSGLISAYLLVLISLIEDCHVIERNLGNIERVIRLFAGLLFGAWSISQPSLNAVEWFVMIISTFLILNGIFSRCYLWYVLDINTSDTQGNHCRADFV